MSLKTAQRIAFKIYDRNGNGVIDEKDIIQLFDVAEQYEAMQEDMEIIIKNYKNNNNISTGANSSPKRSSSPKRFPRRMTTLGE